MAAPQLLSIDEAAQCLKNGEVIAYPTEAVYGLGCDPSNESAVRRLLALKNRSPDQGLILIAAELEHLEPWIGAVSGQLMDRACSRWPGPVTWLFPRKNSVPDWLAGKHRTIAIRLTAHPLCRALCSAFGGAIVSTSANPSQVEPARSIADLEACFGDRLGGVVAGELGEQSRPSEIRDLATDRVLREG